MDIPPRSAPGTHRRWIPNRRSMSWLPLVALVACSSPEHPSKPLPEHLDWGPHASELPTLVTVLDTEPAPPATRGLGLAPDGSAVGGTDKLGPYLFTVIDSSNRMRLSFGRSGAGPGELKRPMWLGRTSSGYVAMDGALAKMVIFDSTGTPVRDVRKKGSPVFGPVFILDDSTVVVTIPGSRGEQVPATMSLLTGKTRILIPASDSFLSTIGLPNAASGRIVLPRFGRWLGGVVVADPGDYRLGLYDWNGNLVRVIHRELEPRRKSAAEADSTLARLNSMPGRKRLAGGDLNRKRKQLLAEKLPFFSGSPKIDSQGRLWIMGQAGDSGFADLFGPDGFIGRLPLSCRGFHGFAGNVSGHWLALQCETDDSASLSGYMTKLIRIEG